MELEYGEEYLSTIHIPRDQLDECQARVEHFIENEVEKGLECQIYLFSI